jgi:hypothetical protein
MAFFGSGKGAKKATPSTHHGKKRHVSLGTILLLVLLVVVGVVSLMIYADPHMLDPVNEAIYGQVLLPQADPAVISRWTRTPSFNTDIDASIRNRYQVTFTLSIPVSELGKANPFIGVTP